MTPKNIPPFDILRMFKPDSVYPYHDTTPFDFQDVAERLLHVLVWSYLDRSEGRHNFYFLDTQSTAALCGEVMDELPLRLRFKAVMSQIGSFGLIPYNTQKDLGTTVKNGYFEIRVMDVRSRTLCVNSYIEVPDSGRSLPVMIDNFQLSVSHSDRMRRFFHPLASPSPHLLRKGC